MPFKFEKLEVWKESMRLGEEIYLVTRKFPKDELFNLTSQLMRAADSIALNVSEGSTRQSNPENAKFIGYSIRSYCEVITCLYKALSRKYVSREQFDGLYNKTEILFKRLNKYRSSLN
ncbi:MAG: four helix bundle protein [Bacteroidetes bacterium]|nr:four helix bundle protein [Bacteroidota bacterium]